VHHLNVWQQSTQLTVMMVHLVTGKFLKSMYLICSYLLGRLSNRRQSGAPGGLRARVRLKIQHKPCHYSNRTNNCAAVIIDQLLVELLYSTIFDLPMKSKASCDFSHLLMMCPICVCPLDGYLITYSFIWYTFVFVFITRVLTPNKILNHSDKYNPKVHGQKLYFF